VDDSVADDIYALDRVFVDDGAMVRHQKRIQESNDALRAIVLEVGDLAQVGMVSSARTLTGREESDHEVGAGLDGFLQVLTDTVARYGNTVGSVRDCMKTLAISRDQITTDACRLRF
jgi:hypothetical protein